MPIKSPSYHNFIYFRVHVNIYLDHKIYFVECASFGAVLYSKATKRLDCYNCPATVSSDKIKRTVKPTWQYNGGKIKAWIFDPVLCLFVVKVRFKCKSGLTELVDIFGLAPISFVGRTKKRQGRTNRSLTFDIINI